MKYLMPLWVLIIPLSSSSAQAAEDRAYQEYDAESNNQDTEVWSDADNDENYNRYYWHCQNCRFYIQQDFRDEPPEFERVERETATWPGKREDAADFLLR